SLRRSSGDSVRCLSLGDDFKDKKTALTKRKFQINPWSPGYHVTLDCTGKSRNSLRIGLETDWTIQKGTIVLAQMDSEYVCPWDTNRILKSKASLLPK